VRATLAILHVDTELKKRVFGLLLLFSSLLLVFGPGLALAQEGESVATRLRYENVDGDRVPIEGGRVTVATVDGEPIGEGFSDAEGNIEIPVPGPGNYVLTLDPETLPEGVALRDPERLSTETQVLAGQTQRTIFPLIAGDVTVDTDDGVSFRQVLQLSVEGLKLGLFLGMGAIGLSLIFGTTGLVNFSHSEMIVWGMLVAYFFNFYGFAGFLGFMSGWPAPFGAGINLAFAALFAIAGGAGLGYAMDRWIFLPLRERGVSLISQMVVTIGLSLILRYVFLFIFGGSPRFFADYTAQSAITIGIVDITPKDLVTAGLSILILVGVGLLLLRTKLGKAMRAVADNRDLAESSGIDVQRVIRSVWVLGGSLAGLGGVFIGLSEQVSWNIGFRILLLIFAAVVLGGLGTAFGALVGALVVGVGIQISTLFIPTELKNVGALALLILVLVFRPQGILGRAERIG
jgi:branched-chain amino acid transport system permease protein